jgi:hypothetical protein
MLSQFAFLIGGLSRGTRRVEGAQAFRALWLLTTQQPLSPAAPADQRDDQPNHAVPLGVTHAPTLGG